MRLLQHLFGVALPLLKRKDETDERGDKARVEPDARDGVRPLKGEDENRPDQGDDKCEARENQPPVRGLGDGVANAQSSTPCSGTFGGSGSIPRRDWRYRMSFGEWPE